MKPSRDSSRDNSVRRARAAYFEANNFGQDGGYSAAWVDFSLGPIPFPFPNTPMRVRAVRYHDLHHLLTDYSTDFAGELAIAAWELGAGCGSFVVPWQLNLAGVGIGVWLMPQQIYRAFIRGRRSTSLYGQPLEPLLDLTLAELRARCIDDKANLTATAADNAWFALAALLGMLLAVLSFALGLLMLPFGLAAMALRRRQQKAQEGSESSAVA